MTSSTPNLDQLRARITAAADWCTLRILEQGDTPTCDNIAPRARGERIRSCVRPWGHHGECVHLRSRTIDHLEDHGTLTPFCLSPGEGGYCLLSHAHAGPCQRMGLAEADRRWGNPAPRKETR